MRVKLPDGSEIDAKGVGSLEELVRERKLEGKVIAARVGRKVLGLAEQLPKGAEVVELLDFSDKDAQKIYWHTTSHIMAQAVKRLFPDAKLGVGPAIDAGFYYDFDLPRTLSPEDLKGIEEEMRKIIRENLRIEKRTVSREEAIRLFRERGERFKVELLEEIEDDFVTLYQQGEFVDLCRGPHLPSTGYVKFFKLLSVSGAHWRGDETREMLQRIYGVSFPDKGLLDDYLKRLEEAKKRDHRVLGKQLELFSIHEEAGAGLIFWHPKGAIVRMLLEDFMREEQLKRGYQPVYTPHLLKADIWKVSGHYENYRENMYIFEMDNQEYGIKPMNCPGHILIYKSRTRSYRELPLRFFEFGTVYRYERSGVLHGLLRVRGFTQDDAHIFVAPEDLKEEIKRIVDFAFYVMDTFKFDYKVVLSTRPERFMGSAEVWEKAERALAEALNEMDVKYEVAEGEGAFYGPKIDIVLLDALGREWQGPTIQLDFNLPERFNLTYVAPDGTRRRPVMIHRAILGSMERFLGLLIEHFAGRLPVWLAPVQARVLPITDRNNQYAYVVEETLKAEGFRVDVDITSGTLGAKIRQARLERIPYMLIVGDREEESKTVAVRTAKENLGPMPLEKFVEFLGRKVKSREVI